jgi:hypothetical protein
MDRDQGHDFDRWHQTTPASDQGGLSRRSFLAAGAAAAATTAAAPAASALTQGFPVGPEPMR